MYFNPHHPCGWWPSSYMIYSLLSIISIHTTHVGGDAPRLRTLLNQSKFQSTPPMWVVTLTTTHCISRYGYFNPHHPCGWWRYWRWWYRLGKSISIHTTHVGGDLSLTKHMLILMYFNPHHPCGWWPHKYVEYIYRLEFQSTPPMWVVTEWCVRITHH